MTHGVCWQVRSDHKTSSDQVIVWTKSTSPLFGTNHLYILSLTSSLSVSELCRETSPNRLVDYSRKASRKPCNDLLPLSCYCRFEKHSGYFRGPDASCQRGLWDPANSVISSHLDLFDSFIIQQINLLRRYCYYLCRISWWDMIKFAALAMLDSRSQFGQDCQKRSRSGLYSKLPDINAFCGRCCIESVTSQN